jgi:hypothetical protein
VIVRILGEGRQYDVPDVEAVALNAYDDQLAAALEAGDEAGFSVALTALLDYVRAVGVEHPETDVSPSDIVLPAASATLDDVRELLSEDGLVPD